ncbi:MAG: hypothetical protein ACOX0N_10310 [Syntrophomonadaceae bacterium]|jgi:hypothetical protein|nr:hypothetical protein [Syntrophomonadaceae bacterium]
MTGQTFIHRVTGIKEGTTDDILKNVLSRKTLAQRIARENTEKSIQTIDRMIEENREGLLNVDLLRRAQEEARRALNSTTMAAKIGVLAPVGFFGLSEGLHAPDLDISLLGIGNHRYFLFHSAISLVILRYFYRRWQQESCQGMLERLGQKVIGVALGSFAFGVGVHLALDVVQPKSVVFPFFGSPINGTLIDDRIWFLGNSLWAFKIGRDVFALCIADEIESARVWVKERFEGRDLDVIFDRD